jgi:hypothetical protein
MKKKNFAWMAGGFCVAAVTLLVWGAWRGKRVQELVRKLEEAWAGYHAVA